MKKTSKKSVEKKCVCRDWYFGCIFCKEEFDNTCDLDAHIRICEINAVLIKK